MAVCARAALADRQDLPSYEIEDRMSKVFFEDNNMRTMEKFLDLAVQRQGLIASNVANLDTPGYKTVDLNFQEELQAATASSTLGSGVTNARHIPLTPAGRPTGSAQQVQGLTMRNDLNNVNIDREMGALSSNAMRFSMVAQMLLGKFRTLKAAIQEGRQ
jgi:flagellar basal-body rod protein FlgB